MSVTKISKRKKQQGEKYVSDSTDVSVLQGAVRCIARERHRTWGGKRHHSRYGRGVSSTSNHSGRNHYGSRSRQSQFFESRVTLPTRGASNRGETSTQTVLLVPVVLSLLFMSVHFAVFAHASHVAQLAAQRGAQIASTADGSVDVLSNASQISIRTVAELGGHISQSPRIHHTSFLTGMTVAVEIQRIVPFLPTRLERTVWVSNEQFIMEQNR